LNAEYLIYFPIDVKNAWPRQFRNLDIVFFL